MADQKISELTAVTDIQDTDELVLARAGATNKITGANAKTALGGSSAFISHTVPISNAQILALFTTPVAVVPAAGSGKAIVPFSIAAVMTSGTAFYNVPGELALSPVPVNGETYSMGSGLRAALQDNQVILPTPWFNLTLVGPAAAELVISDASNQPMYLMTDTGNPTDGDFGIALTTYYTVLDVT